MCRWVDLGGADEKEPGIEIGLGLYKFEHVSRLCELRHCAGSFFDFFPFNYRGLRYFCSLSVGH